MMRPNMMAKVAAVALACAAQLLPQGAGSQTAPPQPGSASRDVFYMTWRAFAADGSGSGLDPLPDGSARFGTARITFDPRDTLDNRRARATWVHRETTEDDVLRGLVAAANGAPATDAGRVLVYVHGCCEIGEDALRDAGVFAAQVHYAGPVLILDWASRVGGFPFDSYLHDLDTARLAVPQATNFLGRVAAALGSGRIDAIGHSLGCVLLMNVAAATKPPAASSPVFGQIAGAGCDMNILEFNALAPAIQRNSARVTLYRGRYNDRALATSAVRHGLPRLGADDNAMAGLRNVSEPLNTAGIDVVWVTDVIGGRYAHSYHLDTAVVVNDIDGVLHGSALDARPNLLPSTPAAARSRLLRRP